MSSKKEQFQIRMSRNYNDSFNTVSHDAEMLISSQNNAKLNIGIAYYNTSATEETPHIKFDHTNNNNKIHVYGTMVLHNGLLDKDGNNLLGTQSDLRIKSDIISIENATETIEKLQSFTYKKWNNMNKDDTYVIESGLIAQDIYSNANELKHIVSLSKDSVISNEGNVQSWGSQPATINYIGIIPYLITSIQEMNKNIKYLENKIKILENQN
jgi:hypothetical protein